jgi:hypothetical protein
MPGFDPTPLAEIRDALVARWCEAEREFGRWEDDGGRPAPDDRARIEDVFGRLVRGLGSAS